MAVPSPTPTQVREGWARRGVFAGISGAAVVALLFLILDVAAERPLWTPSALGSALFFNEEISQQAAPRFSVILGYSLVHGVAFVAAGLAASFLVWDREPIWWRRLEWLAAVVFLGLELLSLAVGALMAPLLVGTLGLAWVTIANFIAAVAMSYVLARPH